MTGEPPRFDARPLLLSLAAVMMALACGAGAEEGGGWSDLPTRLAGPYSKLPADPQSDLDEPKVLEAPGPDVAYYGPSAMAGTDGSYTVLFTAEDGSGARILRAEGVDLVHEPTAVTVVLQAIDSWEASRVAHPCLLLPGLSAPIGLFYEGGDGEIGYAESTDGQNFVKHPDNPLVSPDLVEAGARIGQPAAVWSNGTVLLYYAAEDAGSIFLATLEVTGGGVRVEKVDADPASGVHDPVLGPNTFAGQFDESWVSGPMVRVSSEADRLVYDMWYTGRRADGDSNVGFAGSYDGVLFKRFEDNPVLPSGIPIEAGPTVVARSITAVMFYTQGEGMDRAIGAATY